MKVKINCPKCGSENVKITSSGSSSNPTPMYKCGKCTYTHRLFPQFSTDKVNVTADNADADIDADVDVDTIEDIEDSLDDE